VGDEIEMLERDGVDFDGKNWKVSVANFPTDQPAASKAGNIHQDYKLPPINTRFYFL
jgi:hypothetical protein